MVTLIVIMVVGTVVAITPAANQPKFAAVVKEEPAKSSDIPEVVTAKQFELVNDAGKTRAFLGFTKANEPIFTLTDENEKPKLSLFMQDGTGVMTLRDQNGKNRVQIYLTKEGMPNIGLLDAKEDPLVELAIESEGNGMVIHDKNGKIRMLVANTDNNCGMVILDKDGKLAKDFLVINQDTSNTDTAPSSSTPDTATSSTDTSSSDTVSDDPFEGMTDEEIDEFLDWLASDEAEETK